MTTKISAILYILGQVVSKFIRIFDWKNQKPIETCLNKEGKKV